MTDILDSIDGLNFDEEDEVELVEADEVFNSAEVVEFEQIEDFEMSRDEAEQITYSIKSAATATYILLARAHAGKAYRALGYETWGEYVKEEFDISRQHSYQLLDLASSVKMIEEAAPEGTRVKLTIAQARDLKNELPKITERVREETRDLPPDVAGDEVDRIINETREQAKADKKVTDEMDRKIKEAEEEGRRAGLEEAASAFLEEHDGDRMTLESDQPSVMTSSADDRFVDVEVEGDKALSPTDSMHIYNITSSMGIVGDLPEPDDIIMLIPKNRFEEYLEMVNNSAEYFNRLATLMENYDPED